MIGEILPDIYDVTGRPTTSPVSRKRKRQFHGTFPMARYLSEPLSIRCATLKEVRQFLMQCKYVSDQEQFHRRDYWMPPEEFEKRKKGDCDDFSLWTWRQMLYMGYKARYVVGKAGKYGEGHAWVTIEKDGKHFLVEPLAHFLGDTLPRLSTVRYQPEGSVEWDGERVHYFVHEKREFRLRIASIPVLVGEWLVFWSWVWLCIVGQLCLVPYFLLRRVLTRRFSAAKANK
jgi:hypothetical protein